MITDDAVRTWIRDGVAALEGVDNSDSVASLVTNHLVQDDWDELPGGLVEPPSAKRALHLFAVMVETLLSLDRPDLRTMLIMPLPESTRFTRRAPGLARFVEQPWPEGRRRQMAGAGYYLARTEALGWYGGWEDYRRPIDLDDVWTGPPIFAYYRAFKRLDWPDDDPYDRGFYLCSR